MAGTLPSTDLSGLNLPLPIGTNPSNGAGLTDPSGASGGSGIDPQTALLIAGMAGGALSGYNSSKLTQQELAQQKQLAEEQMANQRTLNTQDIAAKESTQDPFLQQVDQGADIAKLDQEANASYSPVQIHVTGPYASYVPQISGGFSYQKSPDVVASANALKRNIEGGNVDPTMTSPANYGKTGALDLVGLQSAGIDPATVSAAGGEGGINASAAEAPVASYMDGYGLRGGGTSGGSTTPSGSPGTSSGPGVVGDSLGMAATGAGIGAEAAGPFGAAVGGGVGALVGAGEGLLNKHAASAPTDFSVQDATTILTNAIKGYLGRDPKPGEVQAMLAGQGLKPGDRWVGQQGLTSVLRALEAQGQAQPPTPSYTGHG